MSWLDFFETKTELKHQFGRGINADIAANEEELFNNSYEAFERKETLKAYEYFFNSLENFSNDLSNQNISTRKKKERLIFEIFQGSAKVTGYVTKEHLYAEVIMSKKSSAHVALKRYILERNYQFTYACYFIDEDHIKLKLYLDNITMTPQKIFFPLREIALNADFDKEYMKCEFPNTVIEDTDHIIKLDEQELKVKYDFMQKWIENLSQRVLTFGSNDNAGMQAFAYLNLLFKIDYLIVPKYDIYQKISKKVQEYFNDETSLIESKNEELKNYINELKDMSYEEFSTNFYNAKYTFNPTEKTSHEEVSTFINESLMKIRWYKNNRYNQIIPTIYKYIAFYILYNYGVNQVTRELLHLLVEIQNPAFFKELDYKTLYDKESDTFSKRVITSRIESIIQPHQKKFKHLEPFGTKLNFSTMNEFSNSFYLQLKNLNFEEI